MHVKVDKLSVEVARLQTELTRSESHRSTTEHHVRDRHRLSAELESIRSKLAKSESRCLTQSNQLTTIRLEHERQIQQIIAETESKYKQQSEETIANGLESAQADVEQLRNQMNDVSLEKKGLVSRLNAIMGQKRSLERSFAELESEYKQLQEAHHVALLEVDKAKREADEMIKEAQERAGDVSKDQLESELLELRLAHSGLQHELQPRIHREERLQRIAGESEAQLKSTREELNLLQRSAEAAQQAVELAAMQQEALDEEKARADEMEKELERERQLNAELRSQLDEVHRGKRLSQVSDYQESRSPADGHRQVAAIAGADVDADEVGAEAFPDSAQTRTFAHQQVAPSSPIISTSPTSPSTSSTSSSPPHKHNAADSHSHLPHWSRARGEPAYCYCHWYYKSGRGSSCRVDGRRFIRAGT